jgi:WD40 repeat protein/serine/threonine protein kinase/DNA-binding XRE family transcriptional regulator
MSNEESFGQLVRTCRRDIGLTQEELAHRVGCAPITLRKIEHDDLRPSLQIAELLAQSLAIPSEERAAFIRLARAERAPEPVTPAPRVEEIGVEDLSGRAIRGYALGERIGLGGMGVVYRATQPFIERDVAIKIILPQYANQPDFIRRFETEAQLIAHLEHPHIVPLYDYWREPGVAYLVMRLLRGGSVRTRLENGSLPLEFVDRLMEQICHALAAAHRLGIIHRDLKPANILLDEDGNAYLSDFGIAKNLGNLDNLTQVDAIVGSPNYISPEQIRSETVCPQTDIYCLGVTLYELLTGALPFQGPTPMAVIYKHITTPLPPLSPERTDLPAALDQVIARATAKDPLERYPDAETMLSAWRQSLGSLVAGSTRIASPMKPLMDTDNPYKGLRAFSEGDAADFFGRNALIQKLLGRLTETSDLTRFLAVVGPSGCGKSSVVKAGLIPAMRRGGLPGSEKWFFVELMPGAHPLEELEAALLRIAVNPPGSLLSQLREGERGLLRAVQRCLPDDPEVELVLVIDQFEELFTLVPEESERAHLLDSLVTAVLDERSRLRLVVTLRADFIDRPLNYVDFGEMLRERMELVLPFTPDELERAILSPVERLGIEWEPGLVAEITHDVGDQPGALPLLQYALTGLFERRDGHRLTDSAYHALGGVLGALGGRAEEVYRHLDPPAQGLARQVFLRLATLGEGIGDGTLSPDTRRRVLCAELETLPGAASQPGASLSTVIDAFGQSRLLAFDRDPLSRGPTVEVAHEALLREWPRLRDWLSTSRSDVRLQRQLAAAASEWENARRDPGYLLAGPRLAQFEGWAAGTDLALTRDEQTYLDTSLAQRQAEADAEAERQRRELEAARKLAESETQRAEEQTRSAVRLRFRNRVITAIGVVALVAAIAATFFGATANANFNMADRLRMAAEAGRLLADPYGNVETAALLSVRALRGGYLPQADATLLISAPRLYAVRTLSGHTGYVNSVAFSPDGKYVLTGSADKTARLWDAASGTEIRTFSGHTDAVVSVVFSPDGKYVLTGSYDNTARLWDASTGKLMRSFGGQIPADFVAFSPDGKYVLTGFTDPTLWDVASGAQLHTFSRQDNWAILALSFSPDGKYVIAGSADHTAIVWDATTGTRLHTFLDFQGSVAAVAFSPDGKYILTGSDDKTAKLWDAATGAEVRTFQSQIGLVTSVAFSPDGKYILIGSLDNAMMRDIATGTEVRTLSGHIGYVNSVAFSPDGKYVVTGGDDGTAKIWDVSDQMAAPSLSGPGLLAFRGHTSSVISVAFSPDGKYVLTGSKDYTAKLWDAATGAEVRTFSGHTDIVFSVAFSPDGKYVLTGSYDGNVKLWNASTGEEIHTWREFKSWVTGVRFSPDGKEALAGSGDPADMRTILWDTATGIKLQTFHGVGPIAFSPDGKYVLTSGDNPPEAVLWDAATGVEVRTFRGHTDPISSVAFSPDGKYVLTGSLDKTAKLWDAATGIQIRTFSGHTDSITSVAFSPDGKYVLTGSLDKTAKLWVIATGIQVRTFSGHTVAINSVAFSPDGKYVLTGSGDNTAQLWNVDYQEDIRRVCARITRDLTNDERAEYGITDPAPTCPTK